MGYYDCMQCDLPDPYDGDGDGIGSCECERCEWCAGPPLLCSCEADDEDERSGAYAWGEL